MEWTYWDASSTAANMNCIKSRFSIATLPWLDEKLKKKQFNNLKENKHGTKHHLTGIRYMDKSCKPSDRRQAEFLVYGRDASLPNYMWRKLNAQCSAMYIRQVHVWLLLIITLNFWTCTKAIAALPTCKTYLNGTYIFLTSTSEHGDSVVKVVNSLRMLLCWDESQNYCWCVRRGICYG